MSFYSGKDHAFNFVIIFISVFAKFEKRLSKYESNEYSRSNLNIFTSAHY